MTKWIQKFGRVGVSFLKGFGRSGYVLFRALFRKPDFKHGFS